MPHPHRLRIAARPYDSVIGIEIQSIASVGADVIEQTGDLTCNFGASYDQPQLAVGPSRPGVHVHGTDEHDFLIDDQGLRVQAGIRTLEGMEALALLAELGPHFGEFHAKL